MAKSIINVKVFVDWENQRIFTRDDLAEYRDELVSEMKDSGKFEVWLDENYCASDVWDNADNINDDWDEYCEAEVSEQMEHLEEVELMCYPHEYDVESPF